VDTVKVWNRSDCCGSRLNGFEVRVGNKQDTSGVLCGGKANAITQGGVVEVDCGKTQGKYVTVDLTKRAPLTLCEVKVFGDLVPAPPTPPPASLCKPGISYKLAYSNKRCANYKIGGKWQRSWTKPGSIQACAEECYAKAGSNCNYLSYAETGTEAGSCLYAEAGCRLESWGNGYKVYKPVTEEETSWTGYYVQNGQKTMDFSLNFNTDGTISGAGTDGVGDFNWSGTFKGDDVDAVKQYVGKHKVDYKGTLSKSKTNSNTINFTGTWTIANCCSAAFHMSETSHKLAMNCENYDDKEPTIFQEGDTSPVPTEGVTFYKHCVSDSRYNQGYRATIYHDVSDISTAGMQRNDVSSIWIPHGWKVELYDNRNYGGTVKKYDACSTANTHVACLVQEGFNDRLESIKVSVCPGYKAGSEEPVVTMLNEVWGPELNQLQVDPKQQSVDATVPEHDFLHDGLEVGEIEVSLAEHERQVEDAEAMEEEAIEEELRGDGTY